MMLDTTGSKEPPIMEWWRIALMLASVGAIVWWAHIIVTPSGTGSFGTRGDAPVIERLELRPSDAAVPGTAA